MKTHYIILVGTLLSRTAFAQNESDALLFSRSDVLGTARYTAMGGAFTALGGDPSASAKNPAGVAVYRDNEFSITPAYHEHFSEGLFYNNATAAGKSNLNIASFAVIGTKALRQEGKWRSISVSFGVDRQATYHQKYTVEGFGIPTSILDDYVNVANNYKIDTNELYERFPFDLYPLWANYLINNEPGKSNAYYKNVSSWPIDQSRSVTATGAKNQNYFNIGGNYDDKLYIGAGLAISNSRLDRVTTISEVYDKRDTTAFIDEFSHTYDETFSAVGWNATLGAIYRPIDALRIGFSWKTPEVMSLEYSLETDNITIEEGMAYQVRPDYIIDEYKFRTIAPMQTTLGVAYTLGKMGLASVEADYVDYRAIRMMGRTDSESFTAENNAIKMLLQPALNLRGGLEYRMTPLFSVRMGYAYFGNPYKKAVISNGSSQIYSAGVGYRTDDFSVDLSYQQKLSVDRFYPYDPTLVEAAKVQSTDHRIALTVGVKI